MRLLRTALALAIALSFPLRPASAATTCVPAQLASGGYPVMLVKARVNGRGPYAFLVDTGATVTIVSAALAKNLRLTPLPVAVQGIGAGGSFSTRAYVASVAVGETHQDRVVVGTFDLTQIDAAVGSIDGLLGYDFLKYYRVTIDYPGRRLCLDG
ncbi:MAG TPA: retropepsin-like aspartic protease [Candidatus Elarobacter sp.]|nr:retropepsin-like aspartic protease [Candidatus Elarobacter sp.]